MPHRARSGEGLADSAVAVPLAEAFTVPLPSAVEVGSMAVVSAGVPMAADSVAVVLVGAEAAAIGDES